MEKLNARWSPERRRLQSKIMSRRLKESPWTEEQNAARSRSQRGKPKTNEARAAMYASKIAGRERTPEWNRLYTERLRELNAKSHWDAIGRIAEERGLTPEDVKFAVDFAFTSTHEDAARAE